MAKGSVRFRRIPHFARNGLSVLILGLFVYAYLFPGGGGVLEKIIKTQFSATIYGTGILDIAAVCILVLALLWGRVFCSVLCPLGTLQELIWRAGNFLRGKKKGRKTGIARSGYAAKPKLRYVTALITGAGLVFAFTPLMVIFDPISSFGRGAGLLRAISGGGAPGGGVAVFAVLIAVPLVLILVIAFFRGRAFCGWCPVGLSLGIVSYFSPFRMRITPSKCASCGICEKKCPAGCIDSKAKQIDAESCVLCFSCTASCPGSGAGCAPPLLRGPLGNSTAVSGEARRDFIKGAFPAACAAVYLLSPGLGRLLNVSRRGGESALLPGEKQAILPPGAGNLGFYRARCIGCQACVAACPERVIKVKNSSRPVLEYGKSKGFCQYNCTVCGEVCPARAIRRIGTEEKHRTRIALSALFFENCVVKTKGEACGACAEVCPTRALRMAAYPEANIPHLTRPVFDEQYCIGCGACLSACPAESPAFRISAVTEQTLTPGMRPPEVEEGVLFNPEDDFPF